MEISQKIKNLNLHIIQFFLSQDCFGYSGSFAVPYKI